MAHPVNTLAQLGWRRADGVKARCESGGVASHEYNKFQVLDYTSCSVLAILGLSVPAGSTGMTQDDSITYPG